MCPSPERPQNHIFQHQYDAAVFIGRFQPPHRGHMALLGHALQVAAKVVVVLGSAWQARSPKNPFSWQERQELIRQALPEADRSRVLYLPIRDFYDEARWVQAVQRGVQTVLEADSQTLQAARRIALIAHFKDASSSYLAQFPQWTMLNLPRQYDTDATVIREASFAATDGNDPALLQTLHEHLPPSTAGQLLQWRKTAAFEILQHEWQVLRDYKASWAGAPYPPVFVTVDALVQCRQHVLLVERGQAPGKGLWALPGGFLEQRESLWSACLRELQEETGLALAEAQWQAAFRQSAVFDHPDRSLRGRTITHVFHFDLGDRPLPDVQGADDAKDAHWTALAQISAMPERFFDDHFHILDKLLNFSS